MSRAVHPPYLLTQTREGAIEIQLTGEPREDALLERLARLGGPTVLVQDEGAMERAAIQREAS